MIEPRLGPSGLKFVSAKRTGRYFTIKGSVSKSYTGRVSVVATRLGSKGTKRFAKKFAVKRGKFTAKLKLKAGRYKFVATTSKTSQFAQTTISNKLAIK
jgi:hypothetical protein